MKKLKFLNLSLSFVLALVSFTGCSEKQGMDKLLDKDDPVTITIWHYYNGVQQTNFDKMVNEFNNTVGHEKGILVESYTKNSISELSDSIIASVKKDAGAEDPPDIFATYAETAYTIDKLGMIADLNPYLTEDEINEYIDEYIEEGKFFTDGSIKIFPTAKSTEIMMVNLTDWQKFADSEGVTFDNLKTLEGLVETAEKYYNYTDALTPDIKNDGKAFYGRDSLANYLSVGAKQLGVEFFSKGDGDVIVNIDEDVMRKLWDNYYVPYVKGYYTAASRYRSDDAKIGSIITLICSTTGAVYYPEEVTINDDYSYPIENVILPVPNFEGCDPYIVQQGAGMSVIKSDEKTEYASSVFLKWFTEENRNIEFSINSGYLPVKKSANDFSKVSDINKSMEKPVDDTMMNAIKTAIDEINGYTLYTSIPFDKSSETRDYLASSMQDSATANYQEAMKRIADGENRDDVLKEYTDDNAFAEWFEEFKTGLAKIMNNQ
ncbi:MAG: extracellular solute-binding protein [Oscillospiraceae bacterium]|nr:extracellular solute-binding protein [Oscillospiraceae bacterium]